MQDRLDVFISSAQEEFEAERIIIGRRISKIPFLSCKPLESRGASPMDVKLASNLGTKNCDIYISILGKQFSSLVQMEFTVAMRRFKPPFIYVKRTGRKDKKLKKFIQDKVKPNFKMHLFNSNTDLYKKIEDNLKDYLFDLLKSGLNQYASVRRKAIKDSIIACKKISRAVAQNQEDIPIDMVKQAKLALSQKDYLSSITKCSIAIETWLRLKLSHKGLSSQDLRKPLSMLVDGAIKLQILDKQYAHLLTEVRIIRNRSLHEGKTPSRYDAKFVLGVIDRIVKI